MRRTREQIGDLRRRLGVGVVTMFAALLAFASGCSSEPPSATRAHDESNVDSDAQLAASAEIEGRVRTFCGDCHATPAPDTFPRDAWFDEVEQGYRLYHESGRSDLDPPPMKDVVAYYRDRAPTSLELAPTADGSPSPVRFTREEIAPPEAGIVPGISHLKWHCSTDDDCRLIVSDMNSGQMHSVRFDLRRIGSIRLLGDGNHPAHTELHDLDGDAAPELLVAGLGSPLPADHGDGSVLSLSLSEEGEEPTTLLSGVGRVADARRGDFTGDGIDDIVVAEFGWRKTGSILLLEGTADDPRAFQKRQVDPRHGGIHIEPLDIDTDGDLDFVALISQEHEQIVAYLNRGAGEFDREIIFDAGDPSYGSSGIQLVDLDGDGDMDVVYTNGDTLDSYVLKPYHAVHWLENTGRYPFVRHTLAHLPGAARALAGDLDADGDLDIAACTFIPQRILQTGDGSTSPLPSMLWLEQSSGAFEAHILETGACDHLCMDLGDFDNDGRLDLIAGNYLVGNKTNDPAWLTVWWNDGSSRND